MTGTEIRRIVIQQSKRANVGHIGSSLSVADIVAALYDGVLRIPALDHAERDRFVLGKGHAVLAVYAAMSLRGWLTQAQLDSYCADGSLLGVHPDRELPGIDVSTGSLGFGLPVGVGAALAARLQGSDRRVFVLVSDAECNEGSMWEAAMFAAHHRLGRLTVMVDLNGQQALGKTEQVLSLTPMVERWRTFGWDAREVDGHDAAALRRTLSEPVAAQGAPRALVARTTFGKGVSYMEGQLKWHYWPMSDDEYRLAMAELER
ncbi:MAG TPA: transketolase [Candidatus Eisenbacteria bacterium]|nr:transketolase [Candidatus Eisenbacteria bacterium]